MMRNLLGTVLNTKNIEQFIEENFWANVPSDILEQDCSTNNGGEVETHDKHKK
jgi:hypothetical protein